MLEVKMQSSPSTQTFKLTHPAHAAAHGRAQPATWPDPISRTGRRRRPWPGRPQSCGCCRRWWSCRAAAVALSARERRLVPTLAEDARWCVFPAGNTHLWCAPSSPAKISHRRRWPEAEKQVGGWWRTSWHLQHVCFFFFFNFYWLVFFFNCFHLIFLIVFFSIWINCIYLFSGIIKNFMHFFIIFIYYPFYQI